VLVGHGGHAGHGGSCQDSVVRSFDRRRGDELYRQGEKITRTSARGGTPNPQVTPHPHVQPDWRPSTGLNVEVVKSILLKTRNVQRKLAEKAVRPAVVTSRTIRSGRRRPDARAGSRADGAD